MTERTQRLLLGAAVIALTVGIGAALRLTRGQRPMVPSENTTPPLPPAVNARYKKIDMRGFEKGRHLWTVAAPVIDNERSGNRVVFTGGMDATVWDSKARPAATLTGPAATYSDHTTLDFTGGLEMVLFREGIRRATLSTPSATFRTKEKTFLAAGTVVIRVTPPPADKPGATDLPRNWGTLTVTTDQLQWEAGAKTVRCPHEVHIVTAKGDEVWGQNLVLNIETRSFTLDYPRGRIQGDPGAL